MRTSDTRSPSHDPKLTTQRCKRKRRNVVRPGLIICLMLSATALMLGQTGSNPGQLTAAEIPPVIEATPSLRITAPVIIQLPEGVGWDTWPRQARARFVPMQIPVGTSFDDGTLLGPAWRLVWPGHPEVVVFLLGDGVILDTYVIPAVGPVPDPPPFPPDPPPPDPPLQVTEVVIVRETKTVTPEQAEIILDRSWEKLLTDKGIAVHRLDPDQLEARFQPLAERAAGNPVVFFVGSSGVDTAVMVALPDSIKGLTELVKEKTQ